MGFLSIEPGPIFDRHIPVTLQLHPTKEGFGRMPSKMPQATIAFLYGAAIRQSKGKMIRLPRGHFPPQEIPSIVVFMGGV